MTTTENQLMTVSLPAQGLWTACRIWARRSGTLGYIPYSVVDDFARRNTVMLVCELTRAGLWQVEDGGWRMVRRDDSGRRVIKGTRARATGRTRGKESGVR